MASRTCSFCAPRGRLLRSHSTISASVKIPTETLLTNVFAGIEVTGLSTRTIVVGNTSARARRERPFRRTRIRTDHRCAGLAAGRCSDAVLERRGLRRPAIPGGGGVWSLLEDQDFLGWVRRIHATTRFTTSVCTSSLLLAAGLLNGLTAATHWGTAGEIEGYGAVYTPERVVRHDRIIYTEYDPQPPFDSGSMAEASPEALERARALG